MAIPYSRTIIGGLPWYSVLIVAGIVLAILLASKEEKRLGLPGDTAVDLALVVVPCGIVGARLYYVAMSWESFRSNPLSVLYIWEGGIAIYGAVIGGAAGALVYAYRKKSSFPVLADVIAPGLLLAQAIGRWGNYFNMEAYGPAIQDPRLCFFPLAVLIPEGGTYVWHAATFFYESVWNAAGFAVLWYWRGKKRFDGELFCWYLLIYGSGRFVIEQLRQDSLYLGGIRASQYLSLVFCSAAALVLLYQVLRKKKKEFAVGVLCAALLLGRWFCLDDKNMYALFLLGYAACGFWVMRDEGKNKAALIAVILTDAAGLLMQATGWPVSAAVAGGMHALLCSLTLPGCMAQLCRR